MVYRHSLLQLSFESFGASLRTPISLDNEWVQLANVMLWKALDEEYQFELTKNAGRAAKPVRLLYSASLIQQRLGLTDRGVVAAIRDTPALQYFVGLFEHKAVVPFSYSSLAHFRKRIADISELINNIINDLVRAKIEALVPFKIDSVITDATAVPIKTKYSQDTVLLNQSSLNLEAMGIAMVHQLDVPNLRMYHREAKCFWMLFSRHPKQQRGGFRKQVKAQLQYVRRDLSSDQAIRLGVIRILFDQQWYMYTHKTHHVEAHIVSLKQPYIRLIQRGKANAKVEFGIKIDCSLSEGVIDVERFDFNAFSKGQDFAATLDHNCDLHGHYPDEVLANTLYRNCLNLKLCKDLEIRICGPKLGRHPKYIDVEKRRQDTDAENRRGAIERRFAFMKGSLGLNLVNT